MNEKEMQDRMADAQARAEKFERLHADGVIEHELRKAAEEAGAFNADQIIRLLKGKSRVVEVDGKHVVRVVKIGDDGKEIHHSPAQAIGHLKQDKGNKGNLFLETMAAMSMLAPPAKLDAKPDLKKLLKNMSHEEYLRLRQQQPELFGLRPLPKRGR